MEKCKYYHTKNKRNYLYDIYSGNCGGWEDVKVGVCWGTKECEECSCCGDKLKCDFYDYIREEAQKEQLDYKIVQAINLLVDNGYEVNKI